MVRQLNLDRDKVDHCYELASHIVSHAAKYIDRHSSPSIEQATLMLLGVEWDRRGVPLASLMVENLTKDQLRLGGAYWWGRALLAFPNEEPAKLAERLGRGKLKWNDLSEAPPPEIRKKTQKLAEEGMEKLGQVYRQAKAFPIYLRSSQPSLAFRFKNEKAKRLRSALQDNFKKEIFSVAQFQSSQLSEESWRSEEPLLFLNEIKEGKAAAIASGLSVPEQTVTALKLGHSAIGLDGWTQSLQGQVDAQRSLVDHTFALSLCAQWPIKILSSHAELDLKPQQLLVYLLLFEQLARRQNVAFENIMLSTSPANTESRGLHLSLAFHQVLREVFSQSYLWYRLPFPLNPFDFLVANLTGQNILELPGGDEAAFGQASHWLENTVGLGDELTFNTHGKLGREAHLLVDQVWKLLHQMQQATLWKSFEEKRAGREGIFQKSFHYWNPISVILSAREESRDPSPSASSGSG